MWRTVARSAAVAINVRRFCMAASSTCSIPRPCIVHKRGADILHDPWFNKQDTGFPLTERDRLGLRGLLPHRVISFEQQYERFMDSYRSLEKNTAGQPDNIVSLAKWRILNRLHDRNETLYYKVLIDNIKDFAPIIYTPTVGLVCQNYSGLFRRPRGMYFSAKDKGEMKSMIYNWPAPEVDMIVLTDGSRILGLGDLGVQGIGIPIGKLDMYVAAAGINPQRAAQYYHVMLFTSTDLGLRERRLEGEEYISIVDELMEALHARWPKAIIQFEDFQFKWAFETLQRYRKKYCMFNDDIQVSNYLSCSVFIPERIKCHFRPLRFDQFCDFRLKVCFSASGSKRFEILSFSSGSLTPSIFLSISVFLLTQRAIRSFSHM
ncbi:putative malate dehydrogenase (decarboxylating) [Helianthus annuus]|uniref:Malate dehydrogenase (Decarboxylating) n=1 Tax=Helianthus annuus TaxID=4232 RepID=A0A9K3IR23_HELAN|nr:putative malate dehydrogenase (decarboxylating) [Helianthus annuus]